MLNIFTAHQHSLLAMLSAVLAIVNLSVCLTVCHTLVSSQNDSSYDHGVFIGG